MLQTFEEIPREEHCDLINVLAGMASRWIAVTMGQLGQGGGHHIANRHKYAIPCQHVSVARCMCELSCDFGCLLRGMHAWELAIKVSTAVQMQGGLSE